MAGVCWELSLHDTTWCWSHVFLLRIVITLNYRLMMLGGVGHMSSFWELSSHWIIVLWCYVVLVTGLPSENCHHIELSSYDATWCWSHVFLLRVFITLNCHLMMLRGIGHISSFWELSSHWIIILWCYVLLVTYLPSEGCHYIELSSYDGTWCWSHVFLMRIVITLNYHLMMLLAVGHMSSFWEFSSHWIVFLWCYVVLVTCLLLRIVITLNYHLMMLRAVGHISAFWELSSHWIIILRCCMVSKSGRLPPGAITVMELRMAYLSSTSGKFVDLMFFFSKAPCSTPLELKENWHYSFRTARRRGRLHCRFMVHNSRLMHGIFVSCFRYFLRNMEGCFTLSNWTVYGRYVFWCLS